MKHILRMLTGLILGIGLWTTPAAALQVAVFPFQDLSKGNNGVNFALTDFISARLEDQGLEVVSSQSVISFMARYRIRRLGQLETYYITRAKDELGAGLLVLGTVSQMREKPLPSLGLTLNVVRTDDARTIWAHTDDISCADVRKLLGIAEPSSTEELLPILCNNIMADWPKNLETYVQQTPALDIASLSLSPTHVRPGEEVRCSVRLRTIWGVEQRPQVYFKVGNRIHSAQNGREGNFYEATWPGGEDDGRYPVTLVVRWPTGRQETTLLGSYYVDSAPPKLALDLKGVSLQGSMAFRDKLLILPRMLNREPISRWHIAFLNNDGDVLLEEEGTDKLPERFMWRGQRYNGLPVGEGEYQVVLKVWDNAGNMAVATQQVAVNRTPPAVILAADNRGENIVVDLRHEGNVPIAFWRMEVRSEDGALLKLAEGQDLPAQVGMALPTTIGNKKVECVVVMKDVLGNEARKEFADIRTLSQAGEAAAKDDSEAKDEGEAWVEEF